MALLKRATTPVNNKMAAEREMLMAATQNMFVRQIEQGQRYCRLRKMKLISIQWRCVAPSSSTQASRRWQEVFHDF